MLLAASIPPAQSELSNLAHDPTKVGCASRYEGLAFAPNSL